MAISDALKRLYTVAPTDDYIIETLELRHPNFSVGNVFITNQVSGWSGNLETDEPQYFQFLPFGVVPPRTGEEGNIELQVAIDNADRQLMERLELLAEKPTSPIELIYRVYLASDQTKPQNDPPLKLDVLGITATQYLLTFAAGLANLRQRPFPSMLYTTDLFPGLAR